MSRVSKGLGKDRVHILMHTHEDIPQLLDVHGLFRCHVMPPQPPYGHIPYPGMSSFL